MKKSILKGLFYLIFANAFLIQSCTSKCSSLRKMILHFYNNDHKIDIKECEELKEFVLKNTEECVKCQKNNPLVEYGVVSEPALLLYIRNVCKNNLTVVACSLPRVTSISPKLYLEHSQSMISYHNRKIRSDFKDILMKFMNNFNGVSQGQNRIFVVNDSIYASNLHFSDLIQSSNIYSITNVGNSSYTDFGLIFDSILKNLKEGEMSMLFSDLIYSTKNMNGVNSQQVLNDVESLSENVFHRYSSDYSLLVLKFHSDFSDTYYPYMGRSIKYSGNRPFYVCLFAKNATMNLFLTDRKFEHLRDWGDYTNFENFHLFTNNLAINRPYYTISLLKSDKIGTYRQDNDELKQNYSFVHSLQDVDYDRNGKLGLTVLVDLSNLYMPEDFKTDRQNYMVEDPMKEGFRIDSIIPVYNQEGVTHKILLVANNAATKKMSREIKISLRKTFPPAWIISSHADSDQNVHASNFSYTTFGLKNMLTGIDKAYSANKESNHFTINIHLKK